MPPERPSGGPEGLDAIGWFIATTHELIGHDKAAAVLGQAPGDKEGCLICAYERERTPEARAAVIKALAPEPAGGGVTGEHAGIPE